MDAPLRELTNEVGHMHPETIDLVSGAGGRLELAEIALLIRKDNNCHRWCSKKTFDNHPICPSDHSQSLQMNY